VRLYPTNLILWNIYFNVLPTKENHNRYNTLQRVKTFRLIPNAVQARAQQADQRENYILLLDYELTLPKHKIIKAFRTGKKLYEF
jgi:hypothetical protein